MAGRFHGSFFEMELLRSYVRVAPTIGSTQVLLALLSKPESRA